MSFYTSVTRYGNKILYCGYTDKGRREVKKVSFQPTLYLSTNEESEWKSLHGQSVKPKKFSSMSDAKDYTQAHDNINNYKIFGNTNYVAQYIAEEFPAVIDFNPSYIDTGNIDIEVASEDGFPEPGEADHPIISITYMSSKRKVFYVWGMSKYDITLRDFDDEGYEDYEIVYRECTDENNLILNFLHHWKQFTPDIITGWNIRLFDIPYIINRTNKVLGQDISKQFSPFNVVKYRQINVKGRSLDAYEIYGVQQMDYYDLFQKFGNSYGTQASYSLDHIASTVLGEKKLSYEEYGSLHALYRENFQKFISYNIKDVLLVDKIDKETGLMQLALTMAYKGGVNYTETFGTTGIWDSIIYRFLHHKQITIPQSNRRQKEAYPGGYVKEPKIGMSKWITSFDLNSLYPNLIVQYNMSPETLVLDDSTTSGVDYYLENKAILEDGTDYAVAANGSMYRKDKRGVLPEIIVGLYDERRVIKNEMLSKKQDYEKNKSKSLATQITQLDNRQMAVKLLLNSLYGALGNQYFRYFDMSMAEGITLSGQLSIRWAESSINKALNKILDTDEDYVIAIDTDSLYVNLEPLVDRVNPKDPVKFIDDSCEKKLVPILQKSYDKMFTHMNGYENRMVMAREAIADRGVWTAKKRYILNVHNNEGVQYKEPKLKIMGIEAVKSSTPQVVRDKFVKAYEIILNHSEEDLQKFVSDFYEEFKSLPAEDVSFPRGVSDIEKWRDEITVYKKGCPIHVRGALIFNKLSKQNKLNVENIKNGSKVKFCYLKKPNTCMENIISFPAFLPKEFGLQEFVDYETQFNKTFKEPLKLVSDAVNWNLDKVHTLEAFFS